LAAVGALIFVGRRALQYVPYKNANSKNINVGGQAWERDFWYLEIVELFDCKIGQPDELSKKSWPQFVMLRN
jgi:hypothetical protein